MSNKHSVLLAVCAALAAAACTPEPDANAPSATAPAQPPPAAPSPAAATETIVAERGGFIPEGIEYDQANGRFLTGSLAEGSIFAIGRATPPS